MLHPYSAPYLGRLHRDALLARDDDGRRHADEEQDIWDGTYLSWALDE